MSAQRSESTSREAELEAAVAAFLEGEGAKVRRDVRCAAGAADLATDDAIYELRPVLDLRALSAAVGRLKLLGAQLNPRARLVVVCEQSSVPQVRAMALQAGVDVLRWDGGGLVQAG